MVKKFIDATRDSTKRPTQPADRRLHPLRDNSINKADVFDLPERMTAKKKVAPEVPKIPVIRNEPAKVEKPRGKVLGLGYAFQPVTPQALPKEYTDVLKMLLAGNK